MAYSGYLIKVGGASGTALPLAYIRAESYKATPAQRMDLDSGRDTAGELHRNVVEHKATKVEFETVEGLTEVEIATISSLLNMSALDRKVTLYYYDNETNSYKSGVFYVPDVTYTIRTSDASHVRYKPIRYAFVEY